MDFVVVTQIRLRDPTRIHVRTSAEMILHLSSAGPVESLACLTHGPARA
jgi:hypothetical protein